jgi:HAD superfamily hydrolase (TIGR01450 family)
MDIKDDIFSIVDMYDAFFVDVYGVLYDGVNIFEDTLPTMKALKDKGKRVIILSNTTQIASDAKIGYAQRGIYEAVHFDEVVTSGEFLRSIIINKNQEFSEMMGFNSHNVKCMFMGNGNIFDESYVQKTDSYDDADFVYLGIPRASYGSIRIDDLFDENDKLISIEDVLYSDWHNIRDSLGRKGPLEFAHLLEVCLKKNKTLLVANPDIFAHGSIDQSFKKVPIFTQGILGRYYEKLGGKVVYFGKPYREIFEFTKRYTKPEDRIVMIGDTPWTDILGANNSNIDSAMVMSGVSKEFLCNMDSSLTPAEKLDILFEKIAIKMHNTNEVMKPTHILRQFAHNKSHE